MNYEYKLDLRETTFHSHPCTKETACSFCNGRPDVSTSPSYFPGSPDYIAVSPANENTSNSSPCRHLTPERPVYLALPATYSPSPPPSPPPHWLALLHPLPLPRTSTPTSASAAPAPTTAAACP